MEATADTAAEEIDEAAGTETKEAGTGQETNDGAGETVDGEEATPRDSAGWRKRVDKLTARSKTAEEERDALKAERDELKAERDALQGTVGDETVLNAAEQAGVLPKFVTKEQAATLATVANIEAQLTYWEGHIGTESDVFTAPDGREYNGRQAATFAAQKRAELRAKGGKAAEIRAGAAAKMKSLLELGEAAQKAGWKPGVKPAAAAAAATSTPAKTGKTPGPGESSGGTRTSATTERAPELDFSKVDSPDALRKANLEAARRSLQ